MMRRSTDRLPRYIATFAIVLLLMAAIEKAGRSFPRVMPPKWQLDAFGNQFYYGKYTLKYVPDADVGFLVSPIQHEVRENGYTFVVETDSKGFPNREPWPDHPTIVLLGDSLVGGSGVGLSKSFPNLAIQMLPGQSMVNLGIGGAGPERQTAIYRKFGLALHPRIVVACLYLESDFDNDLHFHTWRLQGHASDYNVFRLRFAAAQHERGWVQRQFDRSWLLGMAREAFLPWIEGTRYLPPRHRFQDGSELLFDENSLQFAAAPASPDDGRVSALMTSIEELRKLVEQGGATFLVVLIPSKEELFGVPAQAERTNVVARVRERLAQSKVAVLDLYQPIQRSSTSPQFFREDIHLTEYGNQVAANELAGWLQEYLR